MTTPKKPCKKEWNQVEGREGNIKTDTRNQTIDEMDAYYQPIVKELVEALEDIARGQLQVPDFEKYAVSISKQALAKYKAIK
jgi:hypothetical protein